MNCLGCGAALKAFTCAYCGRAADPSQRQILIHVNKDARDPKQDPAGKAEPRKVSY